MSDTDFIYFIQDTRGRVKIGRTYNVRKRLQSLRAVCGDELSLARVVTGGRAVERWFHRKFAAHRMRGEWFWFAPEMMTVIAPDELPVRRVRTVTPPPSPERFFEACRTLGLEITPAIERLAMAGTNRNAESAQ